MKFTYIKRHSTAVGIVALGVIVVAGIAARAVSMKHGGEQVQTSKPTVTLLNVKDYSAGSRAVAANGTVESLQQVDLKSQATGKITAVNVKVGDSVRAGQVVATVDQASAAAALTSARGGLAAAQANYEKLLAGASSEDVRLAQVALDSAKANLENTKKQQEVSVENAFRALLSTGLAATPVLGNSNTATITVSGTYTGSATGSYEISLYGAQDGLRYQYSGLEQGSGKVSTGTPLPLGSRGLSIQFSSSEIPTNDRWTIAVPNTQSATYTANNNAYQAALQGKESSVTAAENAVASAQAALDLKKAQARPADVQAAQAAILSAQGQVQAAQVAYNNTLIIAPFGGTVSALLVDFADLVTMGQKVATVVSPGGLQVKVFVSGADLPFIQAAASVSINGGMATGTVTNIAPSVDPSTRTAEVGIAVQDGAASGLTVGQNVPVVIAGAAGTSAAVILPIQAVKFASDGGAYVYTLDNEGKARQVKVSTGAVEGEHVEVTAGLSSDAQIISNAYDVTEGEAVTVQQQ